MERFFISLLPIPMLIFWLWMFYHMMSYEKLPTCFITVTRDRNPKYDWTLIFFFFNFAAAVFYFLTVYRSKN